MMAKREKTILTDCDGVLFDWEYAFDQWMTRHGYRVSAPNEYNMHIKYDLEKVEAQRLVRMFNESAWIRRLSPLRDAVKYVKKLHEEHGYVFHAITSLSDDEYSQHLRTKNLRELFGPTVFEKYVYLDCGADKDAVLEQYRGTECVWVEDKPENAIAGAAVGLDCYLIDHHHNRYFNEENLNIKRVSNWKELYGTLA